MKKPFSLAAAALNVIRVCIAAGIFVSIFGFFSHMEQSPAIVIHFPEADETSEILENYASPEAPGEPEFFAAPTEEAHTEMSEIQTEEAVPLIPEHESSETVTKTADADEGAEISVSGNSFTAPGASMNGDSISEWQEQTPQTELTAPEGSSAEESGLININEATAVELTRLSGIGEAKAAAVVEYRRINGRFHNIEDIMNVKGIGEKTFEKIRDHITV